MIDEKSSASEHDYASDRSAIGAGWGTISAFMLVSVLQSLTTPPIGLAAFPRLGMLWEFIHFLGTSSSALLCLGFCLVVLINDMVS